MKRVIDTTEVLGIVEMEGREAEVCAEAEAVYDPEKSAVITHLRAFLRPVATSNGGGVSQAVWLPKPQTITEKVPLEEAGEAAREIFKSWVQRLRASAPPIHNAVV